MLLIKCLPIVRMISFFPLLVPFTIVLLFSDQYTYFPSVAILTTLSKLLITSNCIFDSKYIPRMLDPVENIIEVSSSKARKKERDFGCFLHLSFLHLTFY